MWRPQIRNEVELIRRDFGYRSDASQRLQSSTERQIQTGFELKRSPLYDKKFTNSYGNLTQVLICVSGNILGSGVPINEKKVVIVRKSEVMISNGRLCGLDSLYLE